MNENNPRFEPESDRGLMCRSCGKARPARKHYLDEECTDRTTTPKTNNESQSQSDLLGLAAHASQRDALFPKPNYGPNHDKIEAWLSSMHPNEFRAFTEVGQAHRKTIEEWETYCATQYKKIFDWTSQPGSIAKAEAEAIEPPAMQFLSDALKRYNEQSNLEPDVRWVHPLSAEGKEVIAYQEANKGTCPHTQQEDYQLQYIDYRCKLHLGHSGIHDLRETGRVAHAEFAKDNIGNLVIGVDPSIPETENAVSVQLIAELTPAVDQNTIKSLEPVSEAVDPLAGTYSDNWYSFHIVDESAIPAEQNTITEFSTSAPKSAKINKPLQNIFAAAVWWSNLSLAQRDREVSAYVQKHGTNLSEWPEHLQSLYSASDSIDRTCHKCGHVAARTIDLLLSSTTQPTCQSCYLSEIALNKLLPEPTSSTFREEPKPEIHLERKKDDLRVGWELTTEEVTKIILVAFAVGLIAGSWLTMVAR